MCADDANCSHGFECHGSYVSAGGGTAGSVGVGGSAGWTGGAGGSVGGLGGTGAGAVAGAAGRAGSTGTGLCGDGLCEWYEHGICADCVLVKTCVPGSCDANEDCGAGYECTGTPPGAGGATGSRCGDSVCTSGESIENC